MLYKEGYATQDLILGTKPRPEYWNPWRRRGQTMTSTSSHDGPAHFTCIKSGCHQHNMGFPKGGGQVKQTSIWVPKDPTSSNALVIGWPTLNLVIPAGLPLVFLSHKCSTSFPHALTHPTALHNMYLVEHLYMHNPIGMTSYPYTYTHTYILKDVKTWYHNHWTGMMS